MKLKKILAVLISLAMVLATVNIPVFAEGTSATVVAKIGTTEYTSLAEAVSEASNDAVVELLADVDSVPAINKPITIKGAEGVEVNAAIAENFPDVEGTVTFENLIFNERISTENNSSDQSKMTLKFVNCTFNIPAGTYAIQGGSTATTPGNDVLGGLVIENCTFNGNESTYTSNYMVYAQCVNTLTVTGSTFNGQSMYKGAIHTGDSTEQATVATISGNTITGVARGVQLGNRVEGSTVSIEGNTFENVVATDNETKSGAIYVHGHADTNVAVTATNNTATSCGNVMYNDGNTDIAEIVTTYEGNTKDGESVNFDSDGKDVIIATTPTISGTFNGGHMNLEDPEEIFITTEIVNLNATESVVVEIYSEETLIATTTLLKPEYYVINSLSVKTCLTGDSSSWNTVWEDGMPRADLAPTSGTLYVDGQEMNSAAISMRDSGDLAVDWATLDGVNPVKAEPTGTNSPAYTKEVNGCVRVWGEAYNLNATESVEFKLYSDETLIATTQLNDVGNIIDGDIPKLTWNFFYPESTDEYWTTTWVEGHPNSAAQPTKVEMHLDGTLVSTTAAKMSGADDLNPVVWRELGGVEVADLAGTGTAEDPYLIGSLEELKWFRDDVNAGNNYSGKYVELTADIDLNNEEWTPIGTSSNCFKGTFDGNENTISNLKISGNVNYYDNPTSYVGLFGYINSGGSIKNVTINNANVTGCLYVGAVIGRMYIGDAIENCHVTGTVNIEGYWYVGGIAGRAEYFNSLKNCSVVATTAGTIEADYDAATNKDEDGSYVGGIVGFLAEDDTVVDGSVVKNLTIKGATRIGGVSGIAHYGNTISNSTVENVTIIAKEGYTGNDANTIGIIAGACQGTASNPSVFENNTVTEVTATRGEEVITGLYGNNINGSTPITNMTLPTATVTDISETELEEKNAPELTFALKFKADEVTEEQLAYYGDWYADFVLTVNKDVTFEADSETSNGYLAGEYGTYGWISVPLTGSPVTLKAGESIKIMEYAASLMNQDGLKVTYNDVVTGVQEFNCGVFFTPEFLAANPDLDVTLELRMYNPEDETESYVIGETYDFTPVAPELPTATVTSIVSPADVPLTFALNFLADEIDAYQLAYYENWYADFELTVSKPVTFNADGSADGHLAGQYDEWSENWVSVPFEDVTVDANNPLKIMEYAAELMGKPGLKYTYGEVYNYVKDFDCGVYFTPEFLEKNPDLEVTLSLNMYNPEDETEKYSVGKTYTFKASEVSAVTAVAYDADGNAIFTASGDTLSEALENVAIFSAFGAKSVELRLNKNVTETTPVVITMPTTIYGYGTTLTSTANRVINVSSGATVTINDLTIDGSGVSERGINLIQGANNLTLNDVTVENVTHYAINVADSGAGSTITVNNSEITGYAALNICGEGNTVTVNNSTLNGVNNYSTDTSNRFATVVVYEADNTVVVNKNSVITASGTNPNQYLVQVGSNSSLVVPAVYAEEIQKAGYRTEATETDGLIKVLGMIWVDVEVGTDVRVSTNLAEAGNVVVVAAYDDEGRMLETDYVKVEESDLNNCEVDVSADVSEIGNVKAFLVESFTTLKPLCTNYALYDC